MHQCLNILQNLSTIFLMKDCFVYRWASWLTCSIKYLKPINFLILLLTVLFYCISPYYFCKLREVTFECFPTMLQRLNSVSTLYEFSLSAASILQPLYLLWTQKRSHLYKNTPIQHTMEKWSVISNVATLKMPANFHCLEQSPFTSAPNSTPMHGPNSLCIFSI